MFEPIKKLAVQAMMYGIGGIAARMVAFFLLPAFTYFLAPDEFGAYTLYYVAIAVAMNMFVLGQDTAMIHFYDPKESWIKRRTVFSTIFWLGLVVTTLLAALLYFGSEFWVRLIINLEDPYPKWAVDTFKLCAWIIFLDTMAVYPMAALRKDEKVVLVNVLQLIRAIVQTGMTLIFLYKGWGLEGIFLANLISSTTMLILCLPAVSYRLRAVFNWDILKANLKFGLPNMPSVLFVAVVIDLSDRKILELICGLKEAGLYAAGYRLGVFLAIVVTAFRSAWQPFLHNFSDHPEARAMYGRVLTYYLAVVGWLYLLLTAYVEPLVTWTIPIVNRSLIAAEYWQGLVIFPIVAFAHIFNGVYVVFMAGIYLKEKTRVTPVITGIAMAMNVVGNILLIPHFGMWGAAWMTVAAYASMAVMLYFYVNRHYNVSYEWERVIHLGIVGGITFAFGVIGRLYGMQWLGYLVSLMFPLFLLLSGWMTPEERTRIFALLGNRLKRNN
ncbi:MAG: oligosaccharide flippase family protein [Candidatus Electryoneaceae bacterium]|nr:oligosaccharide flippase family protein [Candidatus Electryoneaceae bacterium]